MSTIREYVQENFEPSTIKDITEHGMVSGFGQLIYYKDTCAFYDSYETEIWDMLEEDRDSHGFNATFDLIATFNGQRNVGSMHQFKNMLCWYAVERVCNDLIEEGDSE